MQDVPRIEESSGLQQGLKKRHMNLIALGGVIGAGLFVGSGVVVQATGPAATISFLIAGVLIVLVMRMLAEMAVAKTAVGSFYMYAREGIGNRSGFVVGWMYWYFFVVVVALEAVAGGRIVHLWLPHIPLWVICLVLMAVLTATNLASTRSFGEFEYWFSSVKVLAIVVFLGLGALYVLGLWPKSEGGFSNLVSHGGFAPLGIGAVLAAVVPCLGFYTGAEIVTVAAAESSEPGKAVAKAMKSIVFRVLAFYIMSIFLVVAILPWDSGATAVSPYAAVLGVLGVPGVETIMNAVVLVAVLSCLNSALYTTSRMLFALTRNGDAPKGLTRLSRNGVPRRAILTGSLVGFISVIFAYLSPDLIFEFIVNSYGAIALFVYLMIAISQVAMRRRMIRAGVEPELKMWLFPWLSYATIAAMVAVIIAMAILPDSRTSFLLSLFTVLVILVAYEVRIRRDRRPNARGRVYPDGPSSGSPRGNRPMGPRDSAPAAGVANPAVDRGRPDPTVQY